MAKCTGITKVSEDLVRVEIDKISEAYMFMSYSEALEFVDKDVVVEFRKDMLNGNIETFVKTLTRPVVVNTLERKENFKLFCKERTTQSDIAFIDIPVGSGRKQVKLYCIETTYGKAELSGSDWMNLRCIDRIGKEAVIKFFSPDSDSYNYAGMYLEMDLNHTSYGWRCKYPTPLPGSYPINPEVDMAKEFLMQTYSEDTEFFDVVQKNNLLDNLYKTITREKGYPLIEVAVQVSLVNEMYNLLSTEDLDIDVVKRACLCSKLYLISDKELYSKGVLNIIASSRFGLKKVSTLHNCLDENPTAVTKEREVYICVVEMAERLLQIKREVI